MARVYGDAASARPIPPSALIATTTSGGACQTARRTKPDQRQREISRRLHRARPDRVVKRRAKQADHRRVDAPHDRLRVGAPPEGFPERQGAHEHEDARQENGNQADDRAGYAVRRRFHDCAEVGRKGKQRSGHGLRGAIAGQECIVADPARRHGRLAQQRQNDVSATKHQGAGAIERVEQRETLRMERSVQRR